MRRRRKLKNNLTTQISRSQAKKRRWKRRKTLLVLLRNGPLNPQTHHNKAATELNRWRNRDATIIKLILGTSQTKLRRVPFLSSSIYMILCWPDLRKWRILQTKWGRKTILSLPISCCRSIWDVERWPTITIVYPFSCDTRLCTIWRDRRKERSSRGRSVGNIEESWDTCSIYTRSAREDSAGSSPTSGGPKELTWSTSSGTVAAESPCGHPRRPVVRSTKCVRSRAPAFSTRATSATFGFRMRSKRGLRLIRASSVLFLAREVNTKSRVRDCLRFWR